MSSADNIHDAVRDSNTDRVRAILASMPESVNERNEDGHTALHLTASGAFGKHEIAEVLLAYGADANAADSQGFTTLHKAAECGDTKLASILLTHGALVDAEDERGRTALQHAVFWRQTAYAELLIKHGANVNAAPEGESLLHRAAELAYPEIVELLIKNGANVNAVDKLGRTPLHYSSKSRPIQIADVTIDQSRRSPQAQTAELLLWAKADSNVADQEGNTPLHVAAKNDSLPVTGILLAFGADPHIENKHGQVPLAIAEEREDTNVASHLSEWEAKKAVFYAAAFGSPQLVRDLISSGGDANFSDNYGTTPLAIAAQHGQTENMRILVEAGANIRCEDAEGWTLAHAAAHSLSLTTEALELVLSWGFDINKPDNDGDTPLHIAAFDGNAMIVSHLLAKGAVVEVRDKEGKTPLDFARQKEHEDVVELLKAQRNVVPDHKAARDSSEVIVNAALAQGWIKDKELNFIPELLPVFAEATEFFFDLVVQSMNDAAQRKDPQSGIAVMQRVCMYLFAKGIEAVMLWRDSPDGKISIGVEPKHLVNLDIKTDLDPGRHKIAIEKMECGGMLFEAHNKFMIQTLRDRQSPGLFGEEYVRSEMRKTIEWIPRIAMCHAILQGYHQ